MSADFLMLLTVALPGIAVGIVIGLIARYPYPEQSLELHEQHKKYSWWAFGLFAILFAGLTLSSTLREEYAFAGFFLAFMILQVSMMFKKLIYPADSLDSPPIAESIAANS